MTDIGPDPDRLAEDERTVRRGLWDKLRGAAQRVPFVEDALAAFYCATDPKTPASAKAVLMGALAYFVMPADMAPDWLLAVGFVDDAAALAAAVQAVRGNLRPEHYDRARDTLARTSAGTSAGDAAAA